MKKTLACTLLFLCVIHSSAQHASMLMGARAMGMANATACLDDEWSLFNNVAGMAKVKHSFSAFSYDAYPTFAAFNRMAAVFSMPVGPGTAAAGVYRFGDNVYNEHIISAGFANTMGLASLGLKVNYIQYYAEGFGAAQAFTVSFGGIAALSPEISIGAHIVNINQPRLTKVMGERVPTVLILGAGFTPTADIVVAAEVEKDLDHRPQIKGGIEYRVHKKLRVRTGFNLNSRAGFGGLGFEQKRFTLDYALQYNVMWAMGHQASVIYRFGKK